MFAAAYYNEISWDQNKRPSKNFNSYGSAETEMHFSFPHIRVLSARLQPWRAAADSCFSAVQNALRDPAFLLHSTFACPAGHGMHGMRAKRLRKSKTRDDRALPARKYGQGNIFLSRMRSGRKQAFRRLRRKNRPDS